MAQTSVSQPVGHETADAVGRGHTGWVRTTHWVVAAGVITLAVSGFVILMAHPRLYWGKAGNDLTPALIELPVSRNYRHGGWETQTVFYSRSGSPLSAVRTYDIFNQNGWARSLHFLAAWFLVITGLAYVVAGFASGHFRRDLLPRAAELRPRLVWRDLRGHLHMQIRTSGGPPYGLLQKFSYCAVVFVALPLMVWTGLAQSPTIGAAYPILPDLFGGTQSARTVHFLVFAVLVLFLLVHVWMVVMSGFGRQMRAMTLGSSHAKK